MESNNPFVRKPLKNHDIQPGECEAVWLTPGAGNTVGCDLEDGHPGDHMTEARWFTPGELGEGWWSDEDKAQTGFTTEF